MTDWLTALVIGLAAVACVVCAVLLARDTPAQDRTFALLAAVEVAVVVQLVLGVVALVRTDDPVEGVLFVSYLVGNLFALPVGVFWSLAERTRAGTAVLLVATFTVIALQARLETIWGAAGV
ncbi:MAG: hypothetical protein CMH83_02020 [Nocardioides sp.]|nr:hypothetical protein [Nocardioides sp.]